MRVFLNLFLVGLLSLIIGGSSSSSYGGGYVGGWSSSSTTNSDEEGSLGPFSVISGPIEDDSVEEEGRQQNLWPWRHHVDFDEKFPGEDQIAMESSPEESGRESRMLPNWPIPTTSSSEEHINPLYSPRQITITDNIDDNDNDDIIIPSDFRGLFSNLPSLGPGRGPAEEEPRRRVPAVTSPTGSSNAFSPFNITNWLEHVLAHSQTQQPWWKGSNVCIKREESEESSITDGPSEVVPESIDDESPFQMHITACENEDTRYRCTTRLFGPQVIKNVRTDYECCHGYVLDSSKSACTRSQYANVAKTIEQLGAKEFISLLQRAGIENKMEMTNITIFVPSDEAIATFLNSNQVETNDIEPMRRRRSILSHEHSAPGGRNVRRRPISKDEEQRHYSRYQSQRHRGHARAFQRPDMDEFNTMGDNDDNEDENEDWKSNALDVQDKLHREKKLVAYAHEDTTNVELQQTLLNHFLQGKLSTDDFVDEKIVFSEGQEGGGGSLRLNTWTIGGERVKTVNCARLTSINHRCTNGIIHVVDRVFTPVTKTIAQVIQSRPELSILNSLLTTSGQLSLLQNPQEHLTFFAPTNAALQKLGPAMLLKFQNGDSCLKRVIRHHILPLTFCSSIVYGEGQVQTIDHDLLDISRSSDDSLRINGSLIITRDIVGTNGVLHIIEDVLLSENDKPLTSALEKSGHSKFLHLLQMSGLGSYLDELNNVTLFVPSDDAIESLPAEVVGNVENLREVLKYHIVNPEIRSCHFNHQELLQTHNPQQSIRVNLYSSFPLGGHVQITAQCGKVTRVNQVACNGVIHEIDRVLIPSTLDLVRTLSTQPDFSIFTRLLKENSELLETLSVKNSSDFHTVFAPTDKAFYALSKSSLDKILNDKETATQMLKRHITQDSLCCAGVAPNLYFMTRRVATLGSVNVPVYREPSGRVIFGHAHVTTCDLTSSNGIIHAIDSVLLEERPIMQHGRSEERLPCLPETLRPLQDLQTLFIRL